MLLLKTSNIYCINNDMYLSLEFTYYCMSIIYNINNFSFTGSEWLDLIYKSNYELDLSDNEKHSKIKNLNHKYILFELNSITFSIELDECIDAFMKISDEIKNYNKLI